MEPTNLSPHDAVCHVPPRHVALDKRDRLSPLESSPAAAVGTGDLAGSAGLNDRSSRPRHSPRRTPQAVVDRVVALRRQRWTRHRIAQAVTVSPATLSRLLRRAGHRVAGDKTRRSRAVPDKLTDRPGDVAHVFSVLCRAFDPDMKPCSRGFAF